MEWRELDIGVLPNGFELPCGDVVSKIGAVILKNDGGSLRNRLLGPCQIVNIDDIVDTEVSVLGGHRNNMRVIDTTRGGGADFVFELGTREPSRVQGCMLRSREGSRKELTSRGWEMISANHKKRSGLIFLWIMIFRECLVSRRGMLSRFSEENLFGDGNRLWLLF